MYDITPEYKPVKSHVELSHLLYICLSRAGSVILSIQRLFHNYQLFNDTVNIDVVTNCFLSALDHSVILSFYYIAALPYIICFGGHMLRCFLNVSLSEINTFYHIPLASVRLPSHVMYLTPSFCAHIFLKFQFR